MKPYFDDGQIRIYNAPWEEVWASLGLAYEDVALLWADPPYGIGVNTRHGNGQKTSTSRAGRKTWEPVTGDNANFDPAPLLAFPRAALWGANHYAQSLPSKQGWWIWDKRDGQVDGLAQADAELAWTSFEPVARVFRHLWSGVCTASEAGATRLHPTQKPVALASWGFQRAKLKPGDLVFSPYLGSGPEARAALDMGLRFIGCEIVEQYCAAAVNRLRQLPLL